MNNIPPELLEFIFSYVQEYSVNYRPDKCLDECMKVCRLWYSVTSKKKYEVLKAYPLHNKYTQKLRLTRIDGRKAIDFAKICRFGYNRFNRQDFQELMHYLPNIRIIQELPPRCLSFLSNENVLKNLPRLEEIQLNGAGVGPLGTADKLFTINLQLKNQITSLTLHPASMNAWKDKYEELVTALSSFRTLKNLHIHDAHEEGTGIIHLNSILNACRSLVLLKISNASIWKLETTNNFIHTSLTSLELYVSNLTENHLKYMVRHLPNLKSFTLCLFGNTFEGVLAAANPSVASELARYLKGLKHFEVLRNGSSLSTTNGLERSMEVLVFWTFLRDLCGKNCYCDLEVRVPSHAEHSRINHFKKQNRNIILKCAIAVDSSNHASWLQQFDFLTFKSIKLFSNLGNPIVRPSDYNFHSWILQPLITRLKQKQYEQICTIDVEDAVHEVKFRKSLQIERRQVLDKCVLSRVKLESGLLKEFGLLFPLVEKLEFFECMAEKEDGKATTYRIDLTPFRNAQRLTLNLIIESGTQRGRIPFETGPLLTYYWDKVKGNQIREPIYIKFINTTVADSFEDYCFNGQHDYCTLDNLEKQHKYETRGRLLFKIYHAGIKTITFKRFGRDFHVALKD